MKITNEAGVDITEAVQILYDIAHSSMDWGSGLLDNEEMEAVVGLAVRMGWEVPSLPDNSPAMLTVAQKFPDHYRIVEIEIPAVTGIKGHVYPGWTKTKVEVIKP